MAKLINSLKNLGAKLTGKEIESNKLVDVINETADNYEGGGSGGVISLYDIINNVTGKTLNWSKVVAFLNALGVDTTTTGELNLDFGKQGIEGDNDYDFLLIRTISSGDDYDYQIYSFDVQSNTGNAAAKSLSQLEFELTPVELGFDSYSAGQLQTYVKGVMQYQVGEGDYVTLTFDWSDFFACFDEANND